MFTESQYYKALMMIKNHERKEHIFYYASVIKSQKPYDDGRIQLTLSLMELLKEEKGQESNFNSYIKENYYGVTGYFCHSILDNMIDQCKIERRRNIITIIDDDN
jgi:hypothetical protein